MLTKFWLKSEQNKLKAEKRLRNKSLYKCQLEPNASKLKSKNSIKQIKKRKQVKA